MTITIEKTGEVVEVYDTKRDISFPIEERQWRGEGFAPRSWTREGRYLLSRRSDYDGILSLDIRN